MRRKPESKAEQQPTALFYQEVIDNIAYADRQMAEQRQKALKALCEAADGKVWQLTFRNVQRQANRLANFLCSIGLSKGDRVMLLLGQNPWTAIGHVACWKAGLVSVPVSTLFAAGCGRISIESCECSGGHYRRSQSADSYPRSRAGDGARAHLCDRRP